ncbi:imm11 family protein [Psychromonas algicola]|uniref:imm11 family protein n=1 Tax=Psychromonas algicola TaxID=2555642 RepID=UPI001068CAA0|nr:DUF1629 domain-containing protein [Psychromonas sp. RZ5]TEW51922.1 hypothetical protein E2R67_05405 [Psychromonas sp. RZ5]
MNDKNFYLMLIDTPWAGPSVEVVKGPDLSVNDGVFIHDVTEAYEINLLVDKQAKDSNEFLPCDIHGPSRTLMFSDQLVNLLTKLGVDNIQYFDADVTYAPTGEKVGYKVANIVDIVGGLDLEKSDVILSRQGNVLEIEAMCLDESKLSGHQIFRLQESIMHVVVHKSIKEAIESAGMTGVMFITDDEYESGML